VRDLGRGARTPDRRSLSISSGWAQGRDRGATHTPPCRDPRQGRAAGRHRRPRTSQEDHHDEHHAEEGRSGHRTPVGREPAHGPLPLDPQAGRRLAAAGTVAVAVVASGVAFAAWQVTATGDGTATASTATEIEDAVLSISADLYPGLVTNGTVLVDNGNPFNVAIKGVTFSNPQVTHAGELSGCTVAIGGTEADVRFTNLTGLTLVIPANDEVTITLPDFIRMDEGAADGCQGATFTADITLDAESTPAAQKLAEDD